MPVLWGAGKISGSNLWEAPPIVTPVLPKPQWIKVRPPGGGAYARLKMELRSRRLHTVCEEAMCPNIAECWGGGTATFMLLGDTCTRGCRFCNVKTGNPRGAVDREEPENLAEAVASLGLDYVVLTMVDRDDMPDGGADHVSRCVERLKALDGSLLVELLMGDFQGDGTALERVAASGADVLAHNVETTEALTPKVRDRRCGYRRSLDVLAELKRRAPGRFTKSSVMVGLGEEESDVLRTFGDLRTAGVDILTVGQYLRPTMWHAPVAGYVTPERFARYRTEAEALGFLYVASGPLVRSSYRAGEFFVKGVLRRSEAGAILSDRPDAAHGGGPCGGGGPRGEDTTNGGAGFDV